jgi:hypothetical protein
MEDIRQNSNHQASKEKNAELSNNDKSNTVLEGNLRIKVHLGAHNEIIISYSLIGVMRKWDSKIQGQLLEMLLHK